MVWSAVLVRFLYICFTLLAPTPIFFTKMFIGELLFAIPSQRVFLVFECDSLVNQCSCVGVWARNQQMLVLPGGAFGGWVNHKCSPAWKKRMCSSFSFLARSPQEHRILSIRKNSVDNLFDSSLRIMVSNMFLFWINFLI